MRPEHFFESAWTLQRPTFALKPFIINKANRRGLVPEFLYFAPGESWINYFPGFPWCRFRFDLFRRLRLCKALLSSRCAQRQQFGFPQRVVGGGWCVQLLPSPERCCCDLKLCPLSHVFFWQLGDRGNKIKLCFGKHNDASHYDMVFRLCSPCMHTQNWWRLLCSRTDPERCNWRRIWCKNQDLTSIHGLPEISKKWSAIPYTNRNGFSCIFCYFGIGAWFISTVWRQSSFQMPRRHTAQPHSRTEKQGTELRRPEEQHGLGNNGEIKCFFSANMLSARCCWWIHFRKLLICFS